MNKIEVENIIRQSSSFEDFVNNQSGKMEFQINNVPIYIWKENVGAKMYYQLPYNADYDYYAVSDFMRFAIPFLSDLVEKRRQENLSKSDF